MDVHHLVNYVIGVGALAAAIVGIGYVDHRVSTIERVSAHVSPLAWPSLTPTQIDELSGALAIPHREGEIVDILCLPTSCTDVAQDLQYAAYMAGWDTTSNIPIMGNAPHGIQVSPDDAIGKALAAALANAIGGDVKAVPGVRGAGRTIAIGTAP